MGNTHFTGPVISPGGFIGPGAVPQDGIAGDVLVKNSGSTWDYSWAAGGSGSGFSWYHIPLATTVTIPLDRQMITHHSLLMDGNMIIDGQFVIFE